jgi:hypothetical protein
LPANFPLTKTKRSVKERLVFFKHFDFFIFLNFYNAAKPSATMEGFVLLGYVSNYAAYNSGKP